MRVATNGWLNSIWTEYESFLVGIRSDEDAGVSRVRRHFVQTTGNYVPSMPEQIDPGDT